MNSPVPFRAPRALASCRKVLVSRGARFGLAAHEAAARTGPRGRASGRASGVRDSALGRQGGDAARVCLRVPHFGKRRNGRAGAQVCRSGICRRAAQRLVLSAGIAARLVPPVRPFARPVSISTAKYWLPALPISRLRLQYWRKRWEGDVTSRPWLPRKQRIDGRVAVLNTRFSHNFYHWMIDILPRLMPLRRIGIEARLLSGRLPVAVSAEGAGGARHRAASTDSTALPIASGSRAAVRAFAADASLPARFGPRRWPPAWGWTAGAVHSSHFHQPAQDGHAYTWPTKPSWKSCCTANRFETHFMEEYPLAKQARLIRESEVIVATHGAGLANLMFARPGDACHRNHAGRTVQRHLLSGKEPHLRPAPSVAVCRACPAQADSARVAGRRRDAAFARPASDRYRLAAA